MECLALIVPKNEGERVRRELNDKGMLRTDLAIASEGNELYIPITGEADLGFDIVLHDFMEKASHPPNYRELVNLPDELRGLLPTSYDIIGSIAVLKLPEGLNEHREGIGSAVIEANRNVRTVALDRGVTGEQRIRDIEIIAGKGETETLHREYGIVLKVDITRAYFSPRLATEHWKVTEQVKDHEVIIDMFSGVGPFAIMVAKHRKPKRIYAIDSNPSAIELLKENIERNKVKGIEPICGDARDVIKGLEKADRIIMNLPHSAFEFFPDALERIKTDGVIHYHEIAEDAEAVKERLMKVGEEKSVNIDVLAVREVRTYSPSLKHYSLDLEIEHL